MKIEVIEAVRVGPDDTLVVVPAFPLHQEAVAKLSDYAKKQNFKIMVLPHNAKVYIKEAKPRANVAKMEGGYQPASNPRGTPPGEE